MERLHARAYCIGSAGPRREVNDAEAVGAGLHFGEGVSLMYDCSRLRSTSSMVCDFLFVPSQKESRQRKEPPPRSLRPKAWGPLPAKTKLARCARSNSRLCFTASSPKPSPAGRPPFQRAGVLNQWSSLGRTFFKCTSPLVTYRLIGVRTHITTRMRPRLSVRVSITTRAKRGRRSGFAARSLLWGAVACGLHRGDFGSSLW